MNTGITIRKIGNHWYPSIKHNSLEEIVLSEKVERVLDLLDKNKLDVITIMIYEQNSILHKNTLQFAEESISRYFTTSDEFDMIIWIGDIQFEISSNLYYLLEMDYGFNFHDTLYCIEVCNS